MDQPIPSVCAAENCESAARTRSIYCSTRCKDRTWRLANRERTRGYSRAWAERNPDANRERARRYRAEHPEKHRAAVRRWQITNAERHAAYVRAYDQANRERRNARVANRAAKKRDTAVVALSPEMIAQKMSYWGRRCWMCGGPFEHVDHVKPLSKGGPHILANLRPACEPCNSSKWSHWYGVAELDRFVSAT